MKNSGQRFNDHLRVLVASARATRAATFARKISRAVLGKAPGDIVTVTVGARELAAIALALRLRGDSHVDVTAWLDSATDGAFRAMLVEADMEEGKQWVTPDVAALLRARDA